MVDKLLSSLQEGHDAEVQLCPVGHGAFQKLFVQSVHVVPENTGCYRHKIQTKSQY